MWKIFIIMAVTLFFTIAQAEAGDKYASDIIRTSAGDLKLTFLGHGSFMMTFGGRVIQVDPVLQMADYRNLPKADMILVTHEHADHFDVKAIELVSRPGKTSLVLTETCAAKITGGVVMKNGDVQTIAGIRIEAVPAYNMAHKRQDGQPYHPKGVGNGYVLTFGDRRLYVAGDTENIPEMKDLKGIHCAFLPMNLPYTMTPQMVADAAVSFRPGIVYPYHFGETDTAKITDLLKKTGIDVRIRNMK
jgi:L-ascorbate metabolism protein UlaG (beta-lactamase superfamily)